MLWLIGFVTNGLPSQFLNTTPALAVQVWRYVTTWFVYPPLGGPFVLNTLLSIFIFVYLGWGAERFFGWRRFAVLVLVTGTAAAAVSGIGLGATYGLTGPIWGLAGAYLVAIWDRPPSRNRLLITIAIWFLISLFL